MKEMEKVCDRIHYYEEFQKSWREVVVFQEVKKRLNF